MSLARFRRPCLEVGLLNLAHRDELKVIQVSLPSTVWNYAYLKANGSLLLHLHSLGCDELIVAVETVEL
jgi:hypothetical protein